MAISPEWVNAISAGINALPVLKSFFTRPTNSDLDKAKALEAVEHIEKGLDFAQIKLAEELGYGLCKKHWPPVIMVSQGNLYDPYTEQFKCGDCGAIWPGREPDYESSVMGG